MVISSSMCIDSNDSIMRDVLAPEPMCLPYSVHFFNWDILRLGQEEVNEDGHDNNKASEEQEETKLEVAEHGQEELANEESEEHVD